MAEKDKKKNDEEAPEAAAPAAPAPKSKNMLLIIGFAVLLVIAAGVPTGSLVMKQRAAKTEQIAAEAAQAAQEAANIAPEGADDQEEVGENEERLGMISPLDTFVVNLAGGKYLRTQVQVEFLGADIPNKFVARLVPIRDALIALLTKKTEADLNSPKGKDELKGEIKDLVNEQLHKEEVKQVYFTQFVIE